MGSPEGVAKRRLANQEFRRTLRRSSRRDFRQNAGIRVWASGFSVCVNSLGETTTSVPSPTVDGGCDLACDEAGLLLSVHSVLDDTWFPFSASFVSTAPELSCQRHGPATAAAIVAVPALEDKPVGCHGEDEGGNGNKDELALQGHVEEVPDANWSTRLAETD